MRRQRRIRRKRRWSRRRRRRRRWRGKQLVLRFKRLSCGGFLFVWLVLVFGFVFCFLVFCEGDNCFTAGYLFGCGEGRVLPALSAPFPKPRILCLLMFGLQSSFHTEENIHSLYINGLVQITTNSNMQIFYFGKSHHLSAWSIFFLFF